MTSLIIPDDLFWVIQGTGGSIVFLVKVRNGYKAVAKKGVSDFYARECFYDSWKEAINNFLFS